MISLSYSLRCVVFHDISEGRSPFTAGMGVSTTPEQLRKTLRFLTTRYRAVSLQDVLSNCSGRGLPPRALLVTFDDAYASIAQVAAPLCREFAVPAVFFVNAAFLDNRKLAPDNLICYVANVHGLSLINKAVSRVVGDRHAGVKVLSEFFEVLLPNLSLAERNAVLETLCDLAKIEGSKLAKEASLYLSTEQLRNLSSFNFEIGNHTLTHTYCRSLNDVETRDEIDQNKAELETLSGTTVRSFSVPYGLSKDLSPALTQHLRRTGHEAVFLSESVANPSRPDLSRLNRIGSHARSDRELLLEIELMPRLRAIRNQFRYSFASA
jgi:peptidoglycan/xylan/chitin deacetylase (PgdA/CDA1 family)